MNLPRSASELLSLLPAIYREDAFVGQYLWAFERVLLDLERQVDELATLFDPETTRAEFLPWLASWMAFMLRADLDEKQQREFLATAISLYRRRGTKGSLQDLIFNFTRGTPTVLEGTADPAGDVPHHFHIKVVFAREKDSAEQLRRLAITRSVIEMEKPAHVAYELEFVFPSLAIGKLGADGRPESGFSTVGVDTLLGTRGGA